IGVGPMYKFVVPRRTSTFVDTRTPGPSSNKKDIERELILQWLEDDRNFGAVFGRQKTQVGMKAETALQAWDRAAKFLNKEANLSLTRDNAKYRILRYRKVYYETARMAKRTGAGVTEDEDDNFEEKLNRECYGFSRWEALFGNNPHLSPACEASSGSGEVRFKTRAKDYTID
ncbi:hypothetical protein BGW38_009765, partial [Lunasporangiospora selenospora]